MGISVKLGAVSNKTYVVPGDDLDTIWKNILKIGPKIDGKNVAALTKTPLNVKIKFDHKATASKKNPGKFDGEFWVKDGTLEVKGNILMPKLKSEKKLSSAAKSEWKRFIGKLAAHEKEHVDKAKAELEEVCKEMNNERGLAQDKTENKAKAAAKKAFLKVFEKKFNGTKLAERITKTHADFDTKSKHGANHGAKLNYGIK